MEMQSSGRCDAFYFKDVKTAREFDPDNVKEYAVTKNGGVVAILNSQVTIADEHLSWPVLPLWKSLSGKLFLTPTADAYVYGAGRQATNRSNPDDHKLNYRIIYCDRKHDKVVSESLSRKQFKTLNEVQAFLESDDPKNMKEQQKKTIKMLRELCDLLELKLALEEPIVDPARCSKCGKIRSDELFWVGDSKNMCLCSREEPHKGWYAKRY